MVLNVGLDALTGSFNLFLFSRKISQYMLKLTIKEKLFAIYPCVA